MHSHLSGNEPKHNMAIFQPDLEGRVREVFNNLPLHFDVILFCHKRLLDHRGALEICLLQQALILVRHHVGLNLGHEIHGHDYDNQQ